MAGCYLFFRLCSGLNSNFPAEELDEVKDSALPDALDVLARDWLKEHPEAASTVEEATKWFTLGDNPADSDEVELDELRWDIDEFRWELGIHPDQPLFLRVAPLAGWGWPLPQPVFGGQVVSERCFFARAPDHATAESALETIQRLAAKSFAGDWLRPHFGSCAESGFTTGERKRIEITYDLLDDIPSHIARARRVLDKVVEMQARFEKKPSGSDSPWVPAHWLWPEKFKTRKGPGGLEEFRDKHPEMFRNPSRNILEIHATKWLSYWAEKEKAVFSSLGEDLTSVADDPEGQAAFIEGAIKRAVPIRAQKKSGKQ